MFDSSGRQRPHTFSIAEATFVTVEDAVTTPVKKCRSVGGVVVCVFLWNRVGLGTLSAQGGWRMAIQMRMRIRGDVQQ